MKKAILLISLILCTNFVMSQNESNTEYNFLRIPVSAHVAALGGENITITENDPSLIFSNPALLSNISDKSLGLNYMNYMQGANTLSASYNFIPIDRGTMAFSAQYMNYGNLKEVNSDGITTGDFNAKDISLAGYFSYLLSDKFSAGVTTKFLTSYIGNYNSIGIAVDLGVNYYNSERDLSVSFVAKNLGGQLKAYDENYENMPFDLQLGISKRLTHTPFRINATLVDINHTNYKFINHLVIGTDLFLSENICVGGGYNFRRANEMSIGIGDNQSSHGAGFTLGGGINLDRLGVNFAWGKYHVASSSVLINLSYKL